MITLNEIKKIDNNELGAFWNRNRRAVRRVKGIKYGSDEWNKAQAKYHDSVVSGLGGDEKKGSFGWVGGDCNVMEVNGTCPTNKFIAGFHSAVGIGILKVGDKIKIKVTSGDKSYNGTHKIHRLGGADGKNPNLIVLNIPKIGTASGTWEKVNYIPYIVGGIALVGVGTYAYFSLFNKKKKKKSKKQIKK